MLSEKNSKYTIFDRLINNNIRFAVYKRPFASDIELILQTSDSVILCDDIECLNGKQGFVIAPFSVSEQSPIAIISPENKIVGEQLILEYLEQFKVLPKVCVNNAQVPKKGLDSFEKYKPVFELFHHNIVVDKLQKLVMSRTLDIDRTNSSSVGVIFERACKKYIQNFVYLCYTPQTGAWLGCSPEVIVARKNGEWKTDALAGTQRLVSEGNDLEWDLKNAQEQAIVSSYVQKQLEGLVVDVKKGDLQTFRSGDLVHLRSEFTFRLNHTSKLGDLLKALHPTPAVSGYPKDEAFRFIKDNECYDRAYYAGFVGVLDVDNCTDLYVNLRCMQIYDHCFRLYAGGGIMPQSRAEDEWLETEYKLETILSIL